MHFPGSSPPSERQLREIEFHREHALRHSDLLLSQPLGYNIIRQPPCRWQNAHWQMYNHLLHHGLANRTLLVMGCGFGDDVLLTAKAGAQSHGYDLSEESLTVARRRAEREGMQVELALMAAEDLQYPSGLFDIVVARDILHHVDIPRAMAEVRRVSKPGALFIMNEVYSHTWTNVVRRSRAVEKVLCPRMRNFVYDGQVYITEDERKLNQLEVCAVLDSLERIDLVAYFNVVVGRLVPERWPLLNKLDRLTLKLFGPMGHLLGGRVLAAGIVPGTTASSAK